MTLSGDAYRAVKKYRGFEWFRNEAWPGSIRVGDFLDEPDMELELVEDQMLPAISTSTLAMTCDLQCECASGHVCLFVCSLVGEKPAVQ